MNQQYNNQYNYKTRSEKKRAVNIPPRSSIINVTNHHKSGEINQPHTTGQSIYIFFNLTYSRWTSSLPSCPWSLKIVPSLPVSRLTIFYRDTSSAILQLVTPMVEFYLLTFPRFPLRKKEHKSYLGKNRTHDFRTSRCAGYLLDHSGDDKSNETANQHPQARAA